MTMLSSIRLDGTMTSMAMAGATDTAVFHTDVVEVLVPSLRPGDLVVMDNQASHKSEPVLALLHHAGAEALFLLPYSPDLNPVEKMWSNVDFLQLVPLPPYCPEL